MAISKFNIQALMAGAMLCSAATAMAQYDQDINVEGKYVPEYIGHDRIGLFPKPMKLETRQSELPFSLTGVNADLEPALVPLQASGWNTLRDYYASRGYINLGIGSWLQSNLSAGYRIVDTKPTLFGIRLQHNSISLWHPHVSEENTYMRRYDENIGLYASHAFKGAGRLDASADWHIGSFNYYGYDRPMIAGGGSSGTASAVNPFKAPTQTLNNVAASVGWTSPITDHDFTWHAAADVRYFGYRRFYLEPFDAYSYTYGGVRGDRETNVGLSGGLNLKTSGKSAIGLDIDARLIAYADRGETLYPDADVPARPDNYGNITLTPYYRFNRAGIDFRLGANVDLTFNAGEENNRFSTFHISPSVKLDYNAGPVCLYLYADGGLRLNTLANNYEYDYYQAPAVYSTRPVYTPLDARFGLTFGPFSGFYAGIDAAYRISRGWYNGGWYMSWLNAGATPGALPSQIDGRSVGYILTPDVRLDMKGFSLGLNLGYDAGRYFKIDASGRWQRQHGETGYFNGYDRPELTVDVSAETNPWSTLRFRVGYQLRALRNMTAPAYYYDSTLLNGLLYTDYRLPNTSDLSLRASYGISRNVDVWVEGTNLLNRKSWYLPSLPEPGIGIFAGAGFRF